MVEHHRSSTTHLNPTVYLTRWATLYSYCSKTPYLTEIFSDQLFPKLSMGCMMLSLFAELCVHMAIFVKKTKIENRAEVFEINGTRIVSR